MPSAMPLGLIALAQRYGVYVTGVEKHQASVEPARANVAAAGVSDRLKPGCKFLSQELLLKGGDEAEIYAALGQAIRVNSTPLSEAGWLDTCTTAGLTVTHHQVGAMELLNPPTILHDEGIFDTLKIT